jgi:hypothetical protein
MNRRAFLAGVLRGLPLKMRPVLPIRHFCSSISTASSTSRCWSTGPGWAVLRVLPAWPRTFGRYTGRSAGAVGGPARTVQRPLLQGASSAVALVDDVYIVGDSGFPGQSALAVAVGGARTAHHVADRFVRHR